MLTKEKKRHSEKARLLHWMMEHEMIVTIIVSAIAACVTTVISMATI